MKTKLLIFISTLLFSGAIAYGHCGSCSTDSVACEDCGEVACESCAAEHADHQDSCADGLLGHYFETQEALATDNLRGAQSAAKGLMADYKESSCSVEGKSCCVAVNDATHAIMEAASIKDARKAFKTLSDTIIPFVKEQGIANGEANLAYCPMAFGNTGASWLQTSKDIANPYFGSAMYSCGVIKQEFGQDRGAEKHNVRQDFGQVQGHKHEH